MTGMMLIVTSQESLSVPTFSTLKVMCSKIGNQFCLLSPCKCNGRVFCSSAATDSYVALTPPVESISSCSVLPYRRVYSWASAPSVSMLLRVNTLLLSPEATRRRVYSWASASSVSLLLQLENLILTCQNQVQTQIIIHLHHFFFC